MAGAALSLQDLTDIAVGSLPRGRRGHASPPTFVRNIQAEELPMLLREEGPAQPPLQQIRFTHHQAARLLAEGRKVFEVSEITGYTPGRLQQLLADPTFKELVHHYSAQVDSKFQSFHERLAGLGIAFTEELQRRLEEEPEKLSNDDVLRAIEKLLDRGGYGAKSTREVTVNSRSFAMTVVEMVKSEGAAKGRVLDVQSLLENDSSRAD